MKKLLAMLSCLLLSSSVFAADYAMVKVHIADPIKENKYFICLYNVGCLSIRAGDNGKVFPMMAQDIGNIEKFVITDVSDNMRMYTTPSNNSCDVQVNGGQTLTVSGQLVVTSAGPTIKNLHCSVS